MVPKTCGLNTLAMTLITVESEAEAEEEIDVELDEEKLKTKVAEKIAERLKALGGNNNPLGQQKKEELSKLEDFELMKTLGEGTYGKVVLVKHLEEKEFYALKIVQKPFLLQNDDIKALFLERNILTKGSKSRFLSELHSSFQTRDRVFLVMEYLNGGDLLFHIKQSGRFSEERARFYSAEIILAILFLHGNGVIYRDLRLPNVMLTADGHVKLADFGMTKENIINGAKTNTFCGTPNYIAPEILQGSPYDGSVDWWALGVLIFEMMAGTSPFDDKDEVEIYQKIQYQEPVIPPSFDMEARNIIKDLLRKDPKERLGCREDAKEDVIKSDKFFYSINWEDLEEGKIDPPFRPIVGKPEDLDNFDSKFKSQSIGFPSLDMTEEVMKQAEEAFKGFSFYNHDFDHSHNSSVKQI